MPTRDTLPVDRDHSGMAVALGACTTTQGGNRCSEIDGLAATPFQAALSAIACPTAFAAFTGTDGTRRYARVRNSPPGCASFEHEEGDVF
jgi:hypothetical protein